MNESDPASKPVNHSDPAHEQAPHDDAARIDPIIGSEAEPLIEPAVTPVSARRRTLPAILVAVLVVVLVLLGFGELRLYQTQSDAADQAAQVPGLSHSVDALQSQIQTLDGRVKTLDGTVTKLANRPAPKPPVAQPTAAPSLPPGLDSQIKAMQANLASLSTTAISDHAAVTTLQKQAADLPKLVKRAEMLARVAQASLALQTGQKLGPIANAPQALARYATANPPTLAGLKASFPGFARKAERAGGTIAPNGGFWQTVKGRVESLVTIRHQNHVLIGSRAAGNLGQAQDALDHDDLAGALAALKPLPAGAAAVMAPWEAQAQHLLAARAALATMAEHG